jgi:hypothetical protein
LSYLRYNIGRCLSLLHGVYHLLLLQVLFIIVLDAIAVRVMLTLRVLLLSKLLVILGLRLQVVIPCICSTIVFLIIAKFQIPGCLLSCNHASYLS